MLTLFHGENFCNKIDQMDISDDIKENFKSLIKEVMTDLVVISEMDLDEKFKDEKRGEII